MPVAVELIAHLLQNSLKLDAIDRPGAQMRLSSIDDEIGPGFRALNAATTRSELVAAEHHFGRMFEVLGDGSVDLGGDLQHDAAVFNVVNEVLAGADIFSGQGGGSGRGGLVADIFSGQGGGSGRGLTAADIFSGQGGGSGFPAAFGAFNVDLFDAGGDLKKVGADLARLAHARSPEALGGIERALDDDLSSVGKDFAALGSAAHDLSRLLGGEGGLAGGMATVGNIADKIGAEFADIFSGQGGGSGMPSLMDDFLKLDSSLQKLSGPLAGMLVPAVHGA